VSARELWLSVVNQAGDDLAGMIYPYPTALQDVLRMQRAAESWLSSSQQTPGSFLWICRVLELSPSAVRANMIKRAAEVKHRAATG
jgi:hypothetical protein